MKDFCVRCKKITEQRDIVHASGTEIVCDECGHQTDFLHDEEEDDPTLCWGCGQELMGCEYPMCSDCEEDDA